MRAYFFSSIEERGTITVFSSNISHERGTITVFFAICHAVFKSKVVSDFMHLNTGRHVPNIAVIAIEAIEVSPGTKDLARREAEHHNVVHCFETDTSTILGFCCGLRYCSEITLIGVIVQGNIDFDVNNTSFFNDHLTLGAGLKLCLHVKRIGKDFTSQCFGRDWFFIEAVDDANYQGSEIAFRFAIIEVVTRIIVGQVSDLGGRCSRDHYGSNRYVVVGSGNSERILFDKSTVSELDDGSSRNRRFKKFFGDTFDSHLGWNSELFCLFLCESTIPPFAVFILCEIQHTFCVVFFCQVAAY
mmetsp:Transcript_26490/g.72839  ORF Transcript_26490/g.72839 Transcript_26490/m.72839 type:complete len:301 (-) Transcript_26490:172-1074(-)